MTDRRSPLIWIPRILVAGILLQTLLFKFTGAPESVWIFTEVARSLTGSDGLATPMRLGSGVVELLAAALLLWPSRRAAAFGAALALATISGAVFFHLSVLGVIVQDDGGLLFALALVVLAGSAAVLASYRKDLLPTRSAAPRAAPS